MRASAPLIPVPSLPQMLRIGIMYAGLPFLTFHEITR